MFSGFLGCGLLFRMSPRRKSGGRFFRYGRLRVHDVGAFAGAHGLPVVRVMTDMRSAISPSETARHERQSQVCTTGWTSVVFSNTTPFASGRSIANGGGGSCVFMPVAPQNWKMRYRRLRVFSAISVVEMGPVDRTSESAGALELRRGSGRCTTLSVAGIRWPKLGDLPLLSMQHAKGGDFESQRPSSAGRASPKISSTRRKLSSGAACRRSSAPLAGWRKASPTAASISRA